jgi:DNA-binding response OmpR family regulator
MGSMKVGTVKLGALVICVLPSASEQSSGRGAPSPARGCDSVARERTRRQPVLAGVARIVSGLGHQARSPTVGSMKAPGSRPSAGPGLDGTGTSVLIVEDDASIAAQLVKGLTRGGYRVDHVTTGHEALQRGEPDVVLLDLELPDLDGVQVCRKLRERSDAAIIVVTAHGEEPDRVMALDAGADDYLVKPFGLAELQARIRAVLRRVRPGGDVVKHGPLVVDIRTRRVTVSGSEIVLTPKEFDILEILAADPGRVVGRQEILEGAWDAHWYGPTKVLDVHMASLRRKLGLPGLIETVYGRGFRLGEA